MAPMSFGLKDEEGEEEDALLKRKYKCFVSKENYIILTLLREMIPRNKVRTRIVFSKSMFHIQS